jgi:hypothetical protein
MRHGWRRRTKATFLAPIKSLLFLGCLLYALVIECRNDWRPSQRV